WEKLDKINPDTEDLFRGARQYNQASTNLTSLLEQCKIREKMQEEIARQKSEEEAAKQALMDPNLQDIVRLTQAHFGDDRIVAYIERSGKSYDLSADEIIALASQGVSHAVIVEMLKRKTVLEQHQSKGKINPGECTPETENASS